MGREYSTTPERYETRHLRTPREAYLRSHWYPLFAAAIAKYCRNKDVLDLGCGGGTYATLTALYANRVLGLDISRSMLSYARSRNGSLNVVLADAHSIPLKTNSVDAVISIGLFEYVERAVVLKEIRRILKPDGVCVIHVPNRYSAFRTPARIACRILGRKYPLQEPSYMEMRALLGQNGFRIIGQHMDDGLTWLPDFLDRLLGRQMYLAVGAFFAIFGRNPFSNVMQFVARKEGAGSSDQRSSPGEYQGKTASGWKTAKQQEAGGNTLNTGEEVDS